MDYIQSLLLVMLGSAGGYSLTSLLDNCCVVLLIQTLFLM
jgi:hypothetical protein